MAPEDAQPARLPGIEKRPNEHIHLTMQKAAEWQDRMISSRSQGI